MENLKPICSECCKGFRTESGLKWHLYHIHGWKDIDELIKSPSPSQLAKIAAEDDIILAAFAKGLGMGVGALKTLIAERFGQSHS